MEGLIWNEIEKTIDFIDAGNFKTSKKDPIGKYLVSFDEINDIHNSGWQRDNISKRKINDLSKSVLTKSGLKKDGSLSNDFQERLQGQARSLQKSFPF